MLLEEINDDGSTTLLEPLEPASSTQLLLPSIPEEQSSELQLCRPAPLLLEFKGPLTGSPLERRVSAPPLVPLDQVLSEHSRIVVSRPLALEQRCIALAGKSSKRSRASSHREDDVGLEDLWMHDTESLASAEAESAAVPAPFPSKRARTRRSSPTSVMQHLCERKRAASSCDEDREQQQQQQQLQDDEQDDEVPDTHAKRRRTAGQVEREQAGSAPSVVPPHAALPLPVHGCSSGSGRAKRKLGETDIASVGDLFKALTVKHEGATWSMHDMTLLKQSRLVACV